MSEKNLNTREYYIAYFDILGYKEYIGDESNDLQEYLKNIIALAHDTADLAMHDWNIINEIRFKLFSDNCIILLPYSDDNKQVYLAYISRLVAKMQIKFLKDYKIVIRGGITIGSAYIDDNIVFGKGLVAAVNLESDEAIYPRIVFDKNYFDKDTLGGIEWIKLDADGKWYIDFFSLLDVKDVFSVTSDEKKDLRDIRDNVCHLVERYGKYDGRVNKEEGIAARERVIRKYLWLLIKYNEFVDRNKIPYVIRYEISSNKRWYRFEITNLKKGSWPIVAY